MRVEIEHDESRNSSHPVKLVIDVTLGRLTLTVLEGQMPQAVFTLTPLERSQLREALDYCKHGNPDL